MRKVLFVFCLILALPYGAYADSDVIATYKHADGSMMTLCTRDARHVRMDTSPTSYMLLQGDKVYAVSRDDEGNWQAMDMDQMQNMGGFSNMFGGGSAPASYEVRYEKTGRSERVAGYDGGVYSAATYEDGKLVSRDEVVLSSHSNIRKLSDGWAAMAARMGQALGPEMAGSLEQSAREAKKMGYGGLLRYGQKMRLADLKVKNLDTAYYALPSGAQQVQVQAPQEQQGADDMGLQEDAKDIGQDAKEATKDEIKSDIRGVIRGLFN